MFYYDVIDPAKEMNARAALRCARLNLRGAKRLLQKGSLASGMSALYDSVLFAMHYYIARHEGRTNVDLGDATALFHMLTRVGVFDDPHAFNRLSLMVERTLWQKSCSFDTDAILTEVEAMLTKLGVVKFTESTLIEKVRVSQ